jgi:hypothetical protein
MMTPRLNLAASTGIRRAGRNPELRRRVGRVMVRLRLLGSAIAIAIVATGCIAESLLPPTASPPPGSPAASAASGTPALAASNAPDASDPIPEASVPEAIAIRDGGVDRREIAVRGFLSRMPVLSCPFVPGDPNPARIDCPASFQWLMANPEQLERDTPNGFEGGPPQGPAFHPSFALVDEPAPPEWQGAADRVAPPVAIEVIGHFDDRRARLCRPDLEPGQRCEDTFVVDQVRMLDGQPLGITTSEDLDRPDGGRAQPASTADDVDAVVTRVDPVAVVLSRRAVIAQRLPSIEPGVAAGLIDAPVVWSVVVVDRGSAAPAIARTLLVSDGGSQVAEMLVVGPAVFPSAQPGPS